MSEILTHVTPEINIEEGQWTKLETEELIFYGSTPMSEDLEQLNTYRQKVEWW
jgi:hypothetical protein